MAKDEQTWFIIRHEKPAGPYSRQQLIQMVVAKIISRRTLIGKTSTGNDWAVLDSIINLEKESPIPIPKETSSADMPRPPMPAQIAEQPASTMAEAHSTAAPDQHPWRRLFARGFDSALTLTIVAISLGTPAIERNYPLNAASLILAAVINASSIGTTGFTLGKWLYGVRILNHFGKPIGFREALLREGEVFVFGCGCGMPLISLLALGYSYAQLNSEKITRWDRKRNVRVEYRDRGLKQKMMAAVAIVLLLIIVGSRP